MTALLDERLGIILLSKISYPPLTLDKIIVKIKIKAIQDQVSNKELEEIGRNRNTVSGEVLSSKC